MTTAADTLDLNHAPPGLIFRAYESLTGRSAIGTRVYGECRMVRCPAANHDDEHPSCKLNPARNTFICFAAGCGVRGGVLDMIVASGRHSEISGVRSDRHAAARWLQAALALPPDPAALLPQPEADPEDRNGRIKLLDEFLFSTHDYRRLNSELAYRVQRFHGKPAKPGGRTKRFKTWYPRPDGRWLTHRPADVEPILYLLPETYTAARAHRVIILVEGEYKADLLVQLGFVATSAPFGGSFVIPPTWRWYFEGAYALLIIPDCDIPGRREAARRREALDGAARHTIVCDPWPERRARSRGYDIGNFIPAQRAAGIPDEATAAELRLMFEAHLRSAA
ncbi:MAG: hypothetical protein EPN48_18495 [Microbacteriaceae bacterium]|nr:MAG: hypothetical protein EPN48_18495 [Microbacteriaceae bacterium]